MHVPGCSQTNEAPVHAAPPLGGGGCLSQGGFGGTAPISYPDSKLNDSTFYNDHLYGQTIFRRENWYIYGSNKKKSGSQCGVPHRVRVCSKEKGHIAQVRHICCDDPLCPVCYPKFSCRLADGVTERILGYQKVYPDDPISHTVISPPKGTRYSNLKEAFASLNTVFTQAGGKAGAFWHHPYRVQAYVRQRLSDYRDNWEKEHPGEHAPGFWRLAHQDVLKLGGLSKYVYYSPHFHGLTSGKLIPSDEFHELTKGWIYKKVARDEGEDLPTRYALNENEISRVAHYISTHSAYEYSKHAVRYIGDISYSRLGRKDKETKRVPAVCPKCGSPMIEHLVNRERWELYQELGDVCETEVMEKIITWQYYKRPPRKRTSPAQPKSS